MKNTKGKRKKVEYMEDIIKKAEEVGIMRERKRILEEIKRANLPSGVWSFIRHIFLNPNPKR